MLNTKLLGGTLLALGSAGGVSFLISGQNGQIFNRQRKWTVSIKEQERVEVNISSSDDVANKDILGEWYFLNTKKSTNKKVSGEGFYSVAVKKDFWVSQNEDLNQIGKFMKLLHCSNSQQEGYYDTDWEIDRKKMKCKDVGNEWLYGVVIKAKKGISMFIKKEKAAELTGGVVQIGKWFGLEGSESGHIEAKLRNLINSAINDVVSLGESSYWGGRWKSIKCSDIVTEEVNEDDCFAWGERYKIKETGAIVANNIHDGNIWIKIIDVSNYTIKKGEYDPIWSTRFNLTIAPET